MQSSARRSIQSPSLDRSDKPDIPLHIKNLVDALEKDVSYSAGLFSARPANPGYPGYVYWATDQHLAYWWDGASWYQLGTSDLIPGSLIDAKGDLIVGLGDNVPARKPVGANTQVLTADSSDPTGIKWALNAIVDLMQAKGDIIAGLAADSAGRVGVGADGTALTADSSQSAGVRFAPPFHQIVENRLTGDVTLATANTFYDGPTVTCTAGMWILVGRVVVDCAASNDKVISKLWDGASNIVDATESNRDYNNQVLLGFVNPGSTTSYKISSAASTNNAHMRANPPDNVGGVITANKTAVLLGVQIR